MAYDFSKFKAKVKETEEWLKKELSNVRTGRASAAILDSIKIESYGSMVPITQVGNIGTDDARSLRIVPWDMSQVKEIEKAITVANLGVGIVTDDKGLRVIFPELTGERRIQITKIAKEKVEEARKTLRMHRDDVMKDMQARELPKDDMFRAKNDAQKLVDEGNKALDALLAKKEQEILN
jgi:ribosome recycling factor